MKPDVLLSALARIDAELQSGLFPRAALLGCSGDSPVKRMQARIEREPKVRDAIDEACRQWARGRGWPKMDEETAVFVWDRLTEARILGEFLREPGARIDGGTEAAVLDWLLVDYWRLAGFYRWYARLWALQRGAD